MKIKLIELRRIIRRVLKEQGVVPGKWNPTSGESIDDDDVERMGSGGLGEEEDSDENENL
jgi:hypothetical protein